MRRLLSWTGALLLALSTTALAAEWTPAAYAGESTLDLLTVGPEEGEHWFPVWLVVLDGQVYVRLGSRAAERIEKNRTDPFVGVRVKGEQFDRVKAEHVPDQTQRVARAMGEKYWSDVVIRYFPHPLTMRLVPEGAGAGR